MSNRGKGATGSRVSSRLEAKRKENAFSVSNNAFQTVKFKLSKIRKQAVTSGVSSKRAAINAVKSEFTGRGFVRLSDADAGPFLAHFRKYKSSKSVIGTLDHKKRPTSMFGFSEIKNNGRGEDGTPDPMGTRLSSDDRSHGFPVSQLINPDHGNKQHFMVGENWLGNQGTTQGMEQLMSSMHQSDTNGPFFGKFRQVEYTGDETRPSLIRDTMLRRTASLNHIDAFSIEHDNEDIDRMHV